MSKQVKLQVPIDQKIRDGLEKRATQLGFDSIQAYIRVWAKAEVDGRTVNFGEEDWEAPPAKTIKRWDTELAEHKKLEAAGKTKSYHSASELVEALTANDIRVVYKEDADCYRFVDIGSHNQVYR